MIEIQGDNVFRNDSKVNALFVVRAMCILAHSGGRPKMLYTCVQTNYNSKLIIPHKKTNPHQTLKPSHYHTIASLAGFRVFGFVGACGVVLSINKSPLTQIRYSRFITSGADTRQAQPGRLRCNVR